MDKIGTGLKLLSKFAWLFSREMAASMKAAGEALQDTADEMANAETAAERLAREQAEAAVVAEKLAKEEKLAAKAAAAVAIEEDAAAEAAERLAKEQKEAAKAAEATEAAVSQLTDTWTGATLKSDEFLTAFGRLTDEQKANDLIMKQVNQKYADMRAVLGPFDKELEAIWQTQERLNKKLEAEKEALKEATKAQKASTKATEAATKAGDDLNARLDATRRRLLDLPTDKAIQDFEELTRVWEFLDEAEREVATKEYAKALLAAAEAGITLNEEQIALIESTKEATTSASGYELALAGLASGMGGATGSSMNLIIAMREHNKAQDQAAASGEVTERKFSSLESGAAKLAFAFAAIGDAIGGTAGKVLNELSGIASAFAKGGIVGAIIAGIGSLIKGLKGLFGRGKRKREKAAKEAAAKAKEEAEAAAKLAEQVAAVHSKLLGLPTAAVTEEFDFSA